MVHDDADDQFEQYATSIAVRPSVTTAKSNMWLPCFVGDDLRLRRMRPVGGRRVHRRGPHVGGAMIRFAASKGFRADGRALQAGDEAAWSLRASGADRWVFCLFRLGGDPRVRFFKGAPPADDFALSRPLD